MMQSIVEMAREKIRGHKLEALLLDPLYYEVTESIFGCANNMVADLVEEKGSKLWVDSRLPSQDGVVIWAPEMDNFLLAMNIDPKKEGGVFVAIIQATSGYVEPCGKFLAGSAKIDVTKSPGDVDQSYKTGVIMMGAAMLALFNAPRITRCLPFGSRQMRRAMQRRGLNPASWHRIEWDLTKPLVQKGEKQGAGWHMPLHYTRGHWRKAESTHDNVVLRDDNKYYKWIEGYWSGHPAYGIKRAVYAPRIWKKEKELG